MRNIGVYFPRVFCVRYGFMGYLSTTSHVEVKGGIVGVMPRNRWKERNILRWSKKYVEVMVSIKSSKENTPEH